MNVATGPALGSGLGLLAGDFPLVPACLGNADAVRASAAKLGGCASLLYDVSGRVEVSASLVGDRWTGEARDLFEAAATEAVRAGRDSARTLQITANAALAYAADLEAAQHRLAVLRRDHASAIASLVAPAAVLPDDRQDLVRIIAAARHEIDALSAAAMRLARRLEASDPATRSLLPFLVDVKEGVSAVVGVGGLARDVARVAAVGEAAASAANASVAASAANASVATSAAAVSAVSAASGADAGAALASAVDDVNRSLVPASWIAKLPGAATSGVLRVLGPGVTAVEAGKDLVIGDPDHDGWRDVATRGMGGVGAGGAVVLLSGMGAPVTVFVAAGAVTAYGAWKVGTAVYDHRRVIARGAALAVDRGVVRPLRALWGSPAVQGAAAEVSRKADEVARSAPVEAVTQAVGSVVESAPVHAVVDGVDRLAERIADSEPVHRAAETLDAGWDAVTSAVGDLVADEPEATADTEPAPHLSQASRDTMAG